jgi:hypothetical protein
MLMRTAVLSGTVVLAACASVAESDAPAILTSPSSETHAAVVEIVSAALNVATVTIAADALTRDSLLVIERTPARGDSGRRLQGREFDKPEQFQLLRSKNRCVLIHVRTGTRYELAGSGCKALGD